MIIQDIYLQRWDWSIKVFYAIDTYYIDHILGELECIGCTESDLKQAEKCLKGENTGLTYSNLRYKCSIVVIGITSSPAEFQNTFDHEKSHLAMHISEALDIDLFKEEYEYLIGEIGQAMFPVAKRFLCEHCRKDMKKVG